MSLHAPPPGRLTRLLDACRLYGRWWVAHGWSSPRVWQRVVIAVGVLAIVLTLVRKPLADWLWPDSRIQQLLDQGHAALRAGELTRQDGRGASELFAAAAALDEDRQDVRAALVTTGQQALAQARTALARGQYAQVPPLLALARQLQMPHAQIAALERGLQQRQADASSIEQQLRQALALIAQPPSDERQAQALALLQQVLAVQPGRMEALEAREDVLSDVLHDSQQAAEQGDLARASALLATVEGFDAGHFLLPDTRASVSAALDGQRQAAQRALQRGQWSKALAGFAAVLAVAPQDAAALAGQQEGVAQLSAQATRLAADFQFEPAQQALAQAQAIAPQSLAVRAAAEALARSRQAQQAMQSNLSAAQRQRRLAALLTQIETAEKAGDWLMPPGRSVYDLLMSAQAVAPHDARLSAVSTRLLEAVRQCTQTHLRANRVRAARGCHDAWQSLAPYDAQLPAVRGQLAQRWLAVGGERLGRGDVEFAREALAQARELGGDAGEVAALAARLRNTPAP